jgi:hypothetical protein
MMAVALGAACLAQAQDAGRLGKELTPAGGEVAANKDGTIPAWAGKEDQASGWSYGKVRGEHWKHKGDKPLFSIDGANVDKYAEKLSPGQVATIKKIKGYRMDVYPTRRTCSVPDFVAENTRKNVGTAKLGADGWSLHEAVVPGFPFPMPKSGLEAMWNAKMRYHGSAVEFKNAVTSLSPRKGSSDWVRAGVEYTWYYPWGAKGSRQLSTLPDVETYVYLAYNSPTALAGQSFMVTTFLDKPGSETFYYFPGQRRVRRMPSYAYDAPQIGFENEYTMDEPTVFYGTLDRFDWKLVGKKEMYIPYNAFGAYAFNAKMDDVMQTDAINPAYRRYELHRVWVVEASVKSGSRHVAPKRTFYLDEDSWNIVAADDYDAQGNIFKVREGFPIPVYETGACDSLAFVQYNLVNGRYVFDMNTAGTGKDVQWVVEGNSPRYKPSFYSADNLRAISDR